MQRAKIHLLPSELRNQIAAGEVVERPASVVKELAENALDAKATEIAVRMEDGGQSLISVQDNGIGIPCEELELAVTRHATSKLQTAADLSNILSYGFRGEALPSIASVSRFRIVSKTKDDDTAHELAVNFGDIKDHAPASLRQGTLVEVRDLFFNIPARLKFLKNPATELKRAAELFVRLALAADGVSMRFEAGNRTVHEFFSHEDSKAKLAKIWSSSIIDELMPVKTEAHGMKIRGYLSNPRSVQPRADRMFLYVNGRAVSDKLLLKAVRQAYAGKITTRDYPQCLLFLEINPQEVDVNVHPAKSEVRFRDEKAVFSLMARAVEITLSSCSSYFSVRDLQNGPQTDFEDGRQENPVSVQAKFGDLYQEPIQPKPQGFWGNADRETRLSFAREDKTGVSEDVVEYFKGGSQNADSLLSAAGLTEKSAEKNTEDFLSGRNQPAERFFPFGSARSADVCTETPAELGRQAKDFGVSEKLSDSRDFVRDAAHCMREPAQAIEPLGSQKMKTALVYGDDCAKAAVVGADPTAETARQAQLPCGLEYLGQVAETYLILKKDGNTLLLLDQHAVHERILYEETKSGTAQSQPLLCALELPLHAAEVLRFAEVGEILHRLGFEISETVKAGQTILEITAIPMRYDRVTAMGFLKEILAEKMDDLDSVWVRHACKSAIKANTPLDRAAAVKLILQWLNTSEPDNCPHGRPCAVHFDVLDLEKLFKRKF